MDEKLIESLSPNERKILPYLKENIDEICRQSKLDKTSVLRALEYLENKKLITLSKERKKTVELGVNGALYRKKELPERRLLNLLNEKRILKLDEAQRQSGLSTEEFKASIGALKKKALIEIKNEKLVLTGSGDEISRKTLEELFIEMLPMEYHLLSPEQLYSLKSLEKRKDIVQIREEELISINITKLGEEIIKSNRGVGDLIEGVTPKLLERESAWRGKKFRRYDVTSPLPSINGGKRHFVNQATDYMRKIWTQMGFQEMSGDIMQSSFWVFDALFTAQDHPVREMQDTFFINKKVELSDRKIVKAVKEAHEKGIGGSKGWGYEWSEEEAKKLVLRTHTTALSAHTLANLDKKNIPAKFFAVGKCFRNETVDWSHGFEFNQTEGIVVAPNLNFRNLLGYLQEFFRKMGFEKVRFRPSYFAYTEPSVEIDVWHPEKKIWFELGGAGILRPEVVIPLFGENITVLAWGPGDRTVMDYYGIKNYREMYENNLNKLRKIKFWTK
ncbi:MAG: phenylalanine--tRNA ligase subunit alpha [Candidatus Nanoarchaeia archaeon]|nr:phenylalanine--tRNA ligase subunit alpha [Candidatus Nanoarchaeia archaeon]MDD5357907.1 phenylalanine--tRNA ligase subunit alpha [Candidatus Nanoarchaeia archaeon]MDD5588826.1 phenylalanine--tRNA ligase subunit alpha [Candidatus Nanoarchaeia archaeon]